MKKFVVLIVSVAVCLTAITALAGASCGGYDDSALLAEIEQLKDELAEAKNQGGIKGDKGDTGDTGDTGPQGPAGPKGDAGANGKDGVSGVNDTLKIYKLGDTVTVYENGMPIFTIKYDSNTQNAGVITNASLRFTNIGLLGDLSPNAVIRVQGGGVNFTIGSNKTVPGSSFLNLTAGTNTQLFSFNISTDEKYIFIFGKTSNMPYAIFEI